MQMNVSQLLREYIGATRVLEVDDEVELDEDGTISQVQGEVLLTRTNRGILARGTIQATVMITCSRCLCAFECPLNVKLEEEFFPLIDVTSGVPLPLPEGPDSFVIDEHHILDLTEAIRQNVLLAIPMKPLCREECAGLCVKCGHNQNEGSCGCSSEEIDPRWSSLVKLANKTKRAKKQKGTE